MNKKHLSLHQLNKKEMLSSFAYIFQSISARNKIFHKPERYCFAWWVRKAFYATTETRSQSGEKARSYSFHLALLTKKKHLKKLIKHFQQFITCQSCCIQGGP